MTLVAEDEEEGREEKLEPKAEKLAKSEVPEGGGAVVLTVGGAADIKVVLVVEGLLNPPIPNGSNEKSPATPTEEVLVVGGFITPDEKRRERERERERERGGR